MPVKSFRKEDLKLPLIISFTILLNNDNHNYNNHNHNNDNHNNNLTT